MRLDSITMRVKLSITRLDTVHPLLSRIKATRVVTALSVMQLLGMMLVIHVGIHLGLPRFG